MMKFGKPSSLMVLSSSCSCLFSQNSSALLTKSCVHMCAYHRARESGRETVCPYVTTVFAHKHSMSIFPFLNMSEFKMKIGNFFIAQPPCAHVATKLMVNVKSYVKMTKHGMNQSNPVVTGTDQSPVLVISPILNAVILEIWFRRGFELKHFAIWYLSAKTISLRQDLHHQYLSALAVLCNK